MEFLLSNYEWIFSGIGIVGLGFLFKKLNSKNNDGDSNNTTDSNNTAKSNNTIVNNINISEDVKNESKQFQTVFEAQNRIKILFVDDDTKFKVVNILKSAGWKNTRIIKDISNLDARDIQETDIFFVDIQGVGKKLLFQDEGLGLANALKNKYTDKKVVIYSAVSSGDRFHEALNKADGRLSKNADPFQFQQLIESLSVR